MSTVATLFLLKKFKSEILQVVRDMEEPIRDLMLNAVVVPNYDVETVELKINIDKDVDSEQYNADRWLLIQFNPDYLSNLTRNNLRFIVEHEIEHVLRDHSPGRWKRIMDKVWDVEAVQERWRYACDMEINSALQTQYAKTSDYLPADALLPGTHGCEIDVSNMKPGQTAEQYFVLLLNDYLSTLKK